MYQSSSQNYRNTWYSFHIHQYPHRYMMNFNRWCWLDYDHYMEKWHNLANRIIEIYEILYSGISLYAVAMNNWLTVMYRYIGHYSTVQYISCFFGDADWYTTTFLLMYSGPYSNDYDNNRQCLASILPVMYRRVFGTFSGYWIEWQNAQTWRCIS